ncbi:DUF5944 family protein [Kineosporia sp. NBRC 101731]|uniref:DUF5944 family protein n=1 Tax=Kineosporia sp. NBRC 101731 TaxID=3032199 RepID=UPI0024A28C9B|nr:DUF5944 family protein [Kineosporia sp. NBRC 101731]GLY33545.1 hypothetical protein Kisp02_69100 [Kineosporia sp. NBRC 101731]
MTYLAPRQVVDTVFGREFDDTDDLSEAFARNVTSELLAGTTTEIGFRAEVIGDSGLKVIVRSTTQGLQGEATISHRFYFIDREEIRTRLHQVSPEHPEAETELLVLLPDGVDRDYFHAAVHDSHDRLLAVQAVVYDRQGRNTRYPFRPALVSDIRAVRAETSVVSSGTGSPEARFTLDVEPQERDREIAVLWESMGLILRYPVALVAGQTQVSVGVSLGPDGPLATGDWVLIAVDENEGFITQALFVMSPAASHVPG